MFGRLFRRTWTELLIALDSNYTLEGFEKTQKQFDLPENFSQLDTLTKRKLTICNLFANQRLYMPDIARVLDTGTGQVIGALIESGLIKERRRNAKRTRKEKRDGGLSVQSSRSARIPSNSRTASPPLTAPISEPLLELGREDEKLLAGAAAAGTNAQKPSGRAAITTLGLHNNWRDGNIILGRKRTQANPSETAGHQEDTGALQANKA